eukprot:SAG11_NODE_6741_length_1256_cov_1.579084_1_plen_75_part_10
MSQLLQLHQLRAILALCETEEVIRLSYAPKYVAKFIDLLERADADQRQVTARVGRFVRCSSETGGLLLLKALLDD